MAVGITGQKILVTGGAGFIGSNLVRVLAPTNQVIVVDDLSEGHAENLDALPASCKQNVTFVRDDIRNYDLMEGLFEQNAFDYIFHLAASFAVQKSVEHPVQDLDINGMGTIHLLQLAQKHSPKLKRFVYASTSCIYGSKSEVMQEDDKPELDSPYAMTKYLGEQYTLFYHMHHKMPTTVVRYFNVYGPCEYPGSYRNVTPKFFQLARAGKPLTVTGTGEESRDFTFVDDAVQGTLAAAASPKGIGEMFNIGAGSKTTVNQLATAINSITKNKAKPAIVYQPRRAWDYILHRRCSNDKAKRLLGWQPTTPLQAGLEKTWAWFEKAVPA